MNLAIISPNKKAYSETFIRAQYENLNFNNTLYYGGSLPQYCEEKLLLSMNFLQRVKRYIYRIIFKKDYKQLTSEAIKKSFKRNKIDAILAQYGPTGVALQPIADELDIPLFVFFHGYDASNKALLQTYKKQYISLTQKAHGIFLASHTLAQNLKSIGCNDKNFIINPCPPNEMFLKNKPDFKKQNILMVGRFTNKKAPHLSILAFKNILENHPDAHLNIAGAGKELLYAAKSLVKALKIEDKVTFLGVLNPAQVKEKMQEAYMFIQHSVTPEDGDQEGSPVAIVEAAAASLPVVSTKHSGIKESVIDGKTGFLVDEFDIDTMSHRMDELLKDKKFAKSMGENAKKHVLNNYMKHFEIIENAINAHC
ncbi:MAG: glycosyltransferase [Bacteroidales bacterium]|nr:glycosyltransferase [Bacteroidales bacterium]